MPDSTKPRRRRRAAPPLDAEVTAGAGEGCRLPAPRGATHCILHEAIEQNKRRLERRAKSNDVVAHALLFGLDWFGPALARFSAPAAPTAAPVPAASASDPFAVLGLEPGCTEDEVRRRQREFARILHADHGGGNAASTRLAEINAAAAECLKRMRA